MGQIDLFENYLFLIGLSDKKKTQKNKNNETITQKNVNMNIQWTGFPNL